MESRPHRDNSGKILAFALIGFGMLLILRKIGFYFNFPEIHFNNLFFPFRPVFHNFGSFLFSWPVVFIIIGLILMAGRRSSGIIFVVTGGIFLIPKILFIPHFAISLLLPLVLIGLGIGLVVRHIR